MHKKHLSKKKIIIGVIVLALLLLILFFFPKSNGHSGNTADINRKCMCIGFESDSNNPDGSWKSTCFGLPVSCVEYNNNDRVTVPMPTGG